MLSASQSVYTRRFGPAWSMASIACRMAGDASSNFNAIFMVQELSFDTSPSILELTSIILDDASFELGDNKKNNERDLSHDGSSLHGNKAYLRTSKSDAMNSLIHLRVQRTRSWWAQSLLHFEHKRPD